MAEYNNSSVGSACNYSTLNAYNGKSWGPDVQAAATGGVHGAYVVPSYGPGLGYNVLQHGNTAESCSRFFTITDAYGAGAQNCNPQYQQSLCMPKYHHQ